MWNILLVDDEPLLLESLEIILTLQGMNVSGKARDGHEALCLLEKIECDLALVDLNMKGMGGIELIRQIKNKYTDIRILVLTTFYDDRSITDAISGGADGYLLKDSGKDAITAAITQIMEGLNIIDGKVMERLAFIMKSGNNTKPELAPDMTDREQEILSLLVLGYNNRQIARQLYISEGTVKNYISSIYDKTGIHDRAKLIVAMKS